MVPLSLYHILVNLIFQPLASKPLILRNVLVAPSLVQKLIYVRPFTTDNHVSIEFDPFGISVKDLETQALIARHNSLGDLYPFPGVMSASPTSSTTFIASVNLWHRRLFFR
jgi:hypothetical protein